MHRKASPLGTFIVQVVSVVVCFVAAFVLVNDVVAPVQRQVIGPYFLGSLVFLPHGVRVLSTWLLRERAILPLALGELISTLYIWQFHAPLNSIVFASLLGGSCCYLLLEIFSLVGLDLYPNDVTRPNWKALIFVAALSSFLNSTGHVFAYSNEMPSTGQVGQIVTFLIGDVTGTVVLMFGLMFGVRAFR